MDADQEVCDQIRASNVMVGIENVIVTGDRPRLVRSSRDQGRNSRSINLVAKNVVVVNSSMNPNSHHEFVDTKIKFILLLLPPS
jgi:hypothetical protein